LEDIEACTCSHVNDCLALWGTVSS
jgi:hypothetical protein